MNTKTINERKKTDIGTGVQMSKYFNHKSLATQGHKWVMPISYKHTARRIDSKYIYIYIYIYIFNVYNYAGCYTCLHDIFVSFHRWRSHDMETLSVLLPLWGEKSTDDRLMSSLCLAWTSCWTNSWLSSDLRRHIFHVTSLYYNLMVVVSAPDAK